MEVAKQGGCSHEASSWEQTARWWGGRVPAVAEPPVLRGGNCPVPGPLGTDHGPPGPACGHRSSPPGSCREDRPRLPHPHSPPGAPCGVAQALAPSLQLPVGGRAPLSRPVWLPFSGESSRRWQESLGCFGFDPGLGGAGRDFPGGSHAKKHLPTVGETRVQSLGWEDPLEKEMATHSSTRAWKNPMDRGTC